MNGPLPKLNVAADLAVDVDGEVVRVTGEGAHLVVDLPSVRAGRRLLSSGPFAANRARTVGALHGALQLADLTAEVRVRGDLLARLGAGARRGALGRVLRLGGAEVRPSFAAAVLRRRPAVVLAVGASLLAGAAAWLLRRR